MSLSGNTSYGRMWLLWPGMLLLCAIGTQSSPYPSRRSEHQDSSALNLGGEKESNTGRLLKSMDGEFISCLLLIRCKINFDFSEHLFWWCHGKTVTSNSLLITRYIKCSLGQLFI